MAFSLFVNAAKGVNSLQLRNYGATGEEKAFSPE
jgi:hypothetical protein